jgi:hypothetical protein
MGVDAGHAQHRGVQSLAHEAFPINASEGAVVGWPQACRLVDLSSSVIAVDAGRADVDGTLRRSAECGDEAVRACIDRANAGWRGEMNNARCQSAQAVERAPLIKISHDGDGARFPQLQRARGSRCQRDEPKARCEA